MDILFSDITNDICLLQPGTCPLGRIQGLFCFLDYSYTVKTNTEAEKASHLSPAYKQAS